MKNKLLIILPMLILFGTLVCGFHSKMFSVEPVECAIEESEDRIKCFEKQNNKTNYRYFFWGAD